MPFANWIPGMIAIMKCGHEADGVDPFSGHRCCSKCFAEGKIWDSQIVDHYEPEENIKSDEGKTE